VTARVPGWPLLSSAAAPVLLIGGWTVAASRQPADFNSVRDTISALAGHAATDRWIMTAGLAGLGVCHMVTALGLRQARRPSRLIHALGGAATVLVAAFPLPADGGSAAHTTVASVALGSLALWPAFAWRPDAQPVALRPGPALTATAVMLGLVIWFGATLGSDTSGLVERCAAGAQALWPLAVVLTARRTRSR
jgi:hypothetical membrane protein